MDERRMGTKEQFEILPVGKGRRSNFESSANEERSWLNKVAVPHSKSK